MTPGRRRPRIKPWDGSSVLSRSRRESRRGAAAGSPDPTGLEVDDRSRPDRGSVSVELTVLFPALLALIFIVVQAGLHYYARSVALAAAEEGARTAAAQGSTAGAGQQAAQAFVARAGAELLTGATASASLSEQAATVTVTGRSISLVPGYDGFAITQQASAPVERVS